MKVSKRGIVVLYVCITAKLTPIRVIKRTSVKPDKRLIGDTDQTDPNGILGVFCLENHFGDEIRLFYRMNGDKSGAIEVLADSHGVVEISTSHVVMVLKTFITKLIPSLITVIATFT